MRCSAARDSAVEAAVDNKVNATAAACGSCALCHRLTITTICLKKNNLQFTQLTYRPNIRPAPCGHGQTDRQTDRLALCNSSSFALYIYFPPVTPSPSAGFLKYYSGNQIKKK
jgi:hypothetical protein